MSNKPKICWIADSPGWAYENRARAVSALMGGYTHKIVLNVVRDLSGCIGAMSEADVIVCPDPRIMPLVPGGEKVLLHLNAVKIFR